MNRRLFALAVLAVATRSSVAFAASGDVVVVEVLVPNTTAELVEQQVTRPLERAFVALIGVTQVKSISGESLSHLEVRYAFAPTPGEVEQARILALAEWRKLTLPASEPTVAVGKGLLR